MKPFFIVGSGRSGTTLLRAILNSSNELYVPPEFYFLAASYRFYANKERFTEKDYRVLSELWQATGQRGWQLDKTAIYRVLCEHRVQSLKGVHDAIFNLYLRQHGLNVQLGIKTPNLVLNIDKVRTIFPGAKIIHMLRDGRDVYLSYKNIHKNPNVTAFGPRTVVEAAFRWVNGMRNLEMERKNLGPDLIEIRYEDLLSNPEETVRSLCEFLQIAYDPAMWSDYRSAAKNKTDMVPRHNRQVHSKVNDGLDRTNINKYETLLTRRERIIFDTIAGPYLVKYGYPNLYSVNAFPVIWTRSLLYDAVHWFIVARHWVRDHHRRWLVARRAGRVERLSE